MITLKYRLEGEIYERTFRTMADMWNYVTYMKRNFYDFQVLQFWTH